MTRLQRASAVVVLSALAVIAYLPAQTLPFIADDYVQIQLGREFGPIASWPALVKDPLYRHRATSIPITHWTEQLWGLNPIAFNTSSLFLHVINVVLVYCLGLWPAIGWKRAFPMAAFFAIAEGHQEAVVWYAAIPELFVFLFSAVSFLAFTRVLSSSGRSRVIWYVAAMACYIVALGSKESGVVVIGAVALACVVERVPLRTASLMVAPFALLGIMYVGEIFWSSSDILHFHDGAFSIRAPVLTTALNSAARILWFWGAAAIAVLAVLRSATIRRDVAAALCWTVIALMPYGFLTYMNRVPSRHTYLASVGAEFYRRDRVHSDR